MTFALPHNRAPLFLLVILLLAGSGPVSGNRALAKTANEGAEALFAEAEKLRAEQLEATNRQAVEKFREAATRFQSNKEFQHSASALRNAGEVLQLLGNTHEALACYQQALALNKKPRNLVERGRLLNNLASLYFITGNTKESRRYSLAALQIATRLRNREIEAAALSNLGEALFGSGEMAKAREYQQSALELWRELNNVRGQAIALVALGYYYTNLGEPERAHRSYLEALSLAQQSNDRAVETLAQVAIGYFRRKSGDKQEALEAYAAAKVIAERIGDQTSQATILGGIGAIYSEMGDKRQALQYTAGSTAIMERNGNNWGTAEAKVLLGRIQHSLDNHEQALRYFTEGLALFRSLRMPRLESVVLRDIGIVFDSLGEKSKALESYRKAITLTRSGEDQREEAYTLNYLGRIHKELKETNLALRCYNRALRLSQRSADPFGEALSRYHLAQLQRDLGNLTDARRHVEAAIAIVESQRIKVSNQDLRTSYFATVRDTYDLNIDIMMKLHNTQPEAGLDREGFAISEKARARSFLELLHEARANVRAGVDPALLAKEKALNEALSARAQLHVQHLIAKQSEEAARVDAELDKLVSELALVRQQIRQTSPSFSSMGLPELLTLKEVQDKVVDDQTVLLEYALGEERSYVWVVTRTEFFSYELPAKSEIEAAAQRLYDLITSYQLIPDESVTARIERLARVDEQIPAETALLSKLVLGPIAARLNKRKILVVADGKLQYIPFSVLLHPDSGRPLIAASEVVNSSSASTHALLQKKTAARKSLWKSVAVLADPVFEADDPRVTRNVGPNGGSAHVYRALRDAGISDDGVTIRRLIASGAEADGIIAAAPAGTGLKAVGFAASRERVFDPELASYRIIHFATHGIVNDERPELSGIVLSLLDSDGSAQNGFLRLHEIYNLRLPVDLVVLSACSTGLGKDVRGEGLISLTRGFLYAGASGVIASLWKVDDDATAELMKHFYQAMFSKGLSPVAALRESQLALSRNKRWQSPYYWAGFVIQGQYAENEKFIEPSQSTTRNALVATFSGLILLTLILAVRKRRRSST